MDDKDKRIEELEKRVAILESNLDYFARMVDARQKMINILKDSPYWEERALKAEADYASLVCTEKVKSKRITELKECVKELEKENCELKDRLDAIKAVLGEGVI